MSDPAPARRRMSARARRALILEAARSEIVAHGLAAVSVRDIARAAGISSGTVTHHFASADDILAGVLRQESERSSAERARALAGARSAPERLRALGERLLADRRQMREYWSLWLDCWARAAHDAALSEWQSERYASWRALVERVVAEGVRAGELRAADPAATATDLVALLDGLAVQAFFERSELTPATATERWRSAVRELAAAAG